MIINKVDVDKNYTRVIDFGCSYSNYRWMTWSDLIAKTIWPQKYIRCSAPASGIFYALSQLNHVRCREELTHKDLVLFQIPALTRLNVLSDNMSTDHNWSLRGDFAFTPEMEEVYFSEEIFGISRFNILDHYMKGYSFLRDILNMLEKLPCDVLVIATDEFYYDLEYALNLPDANLKETLVSRLEDISWDWINKRIPMVVEDNSEIITWINSKPNLRIFVNNLKKQYFMGFDPTNGESIWSTDTPLDIKYNIIDGHPSPGIVNDFVQQHLLTQHSDRMDSHAHQHQENYLEIWDQILTSDDPYWTHSKLTNKFMVVDLEINNNYVDNVSYPMNSYLLTGFCK